MFETSSAHLIEQAASEESQPLIQCFRFFWLAVRRRPQNLTRGSESVAGAGLHICILEVGSVCVVGNVEQLLACHFSFILKNLQRFTSLPTRLPG